MSPPHSHMTLTRSPRTGAEAHADAIERLDAALDDQLRLGHDEDDAQGTDRQLGAGVELSAANERVAAREAWLSYVEHGY